ncbi:enoyl-CoA hydratase-related protein [Arcobacter sp. LA11]|uniref:enoyl-CoA hydratase-related protein n=1 Tax=Arcobacter sp. LA11 TaxID=1898176 RepID=UPI0009342A56|nr:enoyl-CoA hydratase-related protein [Arcobacter sp. LA11]
MGFKDIKVDVEDSHILIITLNRSEVYNALRTNTLKEIHEVLQNSTDEIKCIILTGGEKVFAAGADINELEVKGAVESINDVRTSYWESIKEFKKPIIAAVNGFCLGGGCELAMHCDIIICGDNAQFGQPEINLGIMPGAGGTQRTVKAMGKSNAMLMLLTGDFIDAKTAQKMNLVSEVVPVQSTMIRALEIANKIAKKSPLAISAIKSAVLASYDNGLSTSLKYEKTVFSGILSSEDKKEGISAFKEKRKPNFKGQ